MSRVIVIGESPDAPPSGFAVEIMRQVFVEAPEEEGPVAQAQDSRERGEWLGRHVAEFFLAEPQNEAGLPWIMHKITCFSRVFVELAFDEANGAKDAAVDLLLEDLRARVQTCFDEGLFKPLKETFPAHVDPWIQSCQAEVSEILSEYSLEEGDYDSHFADPSEEAMVDYDHPFGPGSRIHLAISGLACELRALTGGADMAIRGEFAAGFAVAYQVAYARDIKNIRETLYVVAHGRPYYETINIWWLDRHDYMVTVWKCPEEE